MAAVLAEVDPIFTFRQLMWFCSIQVSRALAADLFQFGFKHANPGFSVGSCLGLVPG
jgi:hypothetical protein